jgi:hypothetical protein
VDDPWDERQVGAGEDGEPDGVGVLLERGLDDLLRRLVQPGIDHLHARVPERSCDDLRPAIVAVEAGLRDHDTESPLHGRSIGT